MSYFYEYFSYVGKNIAKKVFGIPTQIFHHKTSWDISLIPTGVKMLYESFQQQYYTLQSWQCNDYAKNALSIENTRIVGARMR